MNKALWLLAGTMLLLAGAALGNRPWLSPAVGASGPAGSAQVAENPAENRVEMINQLQKINDKLDRIAGILESGKVKVVVGNAEELKGAVGPAPAAAVGPPPGGAEKTDAAESKIIIKRKGE